MQISKWTNNKYYLRLRDYASQIDCLGALYDVLKPRSKIKVEELDSAERVPVALPLGTKKPRVGVVKDTRGRNREDARWYWPKFVRFLSYNHIPFDFIDVHGSDWASQAVNFDIILWKPETSPAAIEAYRTKIYFLEHYKHTWCFPAYRDIWCYEDKIRQYYLFVYYNVPCIDTFVSHNYEEALAYIERARYPFVSKIVFSSGSRGVELIRTRTEARRIARRIFGVGYATHWPYAFQKDYCYFQRFIPHAEDLRIICVGDNYFGYYIKVPPGDFRASSIGTKEFQDVPRAALTLARSVQHKLGAKLLAVDFLKEGESYLVSEVHSFMRLDSARQLRINDVPGRYRWQAGNFIFEKGNYWVQELALAEAVREWAIDKREEQTAKIDTRG